MIETLLGVISSISRAGMRVLIDTVASGDLVGASFESPLKTLPLLVRDLTGS